MAVEKFNERRKNQRFQVKERVFAFPEQHVCELGQILDISRGGLSFRYIDDREPSTAGSFTLDLFMHGNDFCIKKLRVRTASDISLEEDYNSLITPIQLRRRGVQFLDLSEEQLSELNQFLKNCTLSEPDKTVSN